VALIRPILLGTLIFAGYAAAFPDAVGKSYSAVAFSGIVGGAVALWILKKMLDLGEGAAKLLLEVLFLAGIAVFIGFTMPQKSGKAPMREWAERTHPGLFPKR
jgi:hypothetical protein